MQTDLEDMIAVSPSYLVECAKNYGHRALRKIADERRKVDSMPLTEDDKLPLFNELDKHEDAIRVGYAVCSWRQPCTRSEWTDSVMSTYRIEEVHATLGISVALGVGLACYHLHARQYCLTNLGHIIFQAFEQEGLA